MRKPLKEVETICHEVNDLSKSNVKTGMSYKDRCISIYDSNCFDDMFGYQVIGRLNFNESELENKYYVNSLKAKLISKVCGITGKSIIAAECG